MPVPSTRTVPNLDPMKLKVVIYAPPGFGKSTLLSNLPDDVLVLALDPGWSQLSGRLWQDEKGNSIITSWEQFILASGEAAKDPSVRAIAVDHVDLMVDYAAQVVCQASGAKSISDMKVLPFGDGYVRVAKMIREWLMRVVSLGKGYWLVTHPIEETIEDGPVKTTTVRPRVPESPKKGINPYSIVLNTADVILCGRETVVVKEDKRSLYRAWFSAWDGTTPRYVAKDRTGKLPLYFECDKETCGAAAFLRAFQPTQPQQETTVE